MTEESTVRNNSAAQRFEIATPDGVAVLNYHERLGHITLAHTEVPKELEGRGYGGKLARAAFEYARATGIRVLVHCPFVKTYLARHPEYQDLTE